MLQIVDGVYDFNKTFGMLINSAPTIPPVKYRKFFYDFIIEELEEYKQAADAGDIVGVADAHTDILYVLLGSYLAHGLDGMMDKLFDEVQASNMSKACETLEVADATVAHIQEKNGWECYVEPINISVYGKDGEVDVKDIFVVKRKEDNKVMKSIKYFAPNLAKFFPHAA